MTMGTGADRGAATPRGALGDFTADRRVLMLAAMALVVGSGGAFAAWAREADRPRHQPRLVRPPRRAADRFRDVARSPWMVAAPVARRPRHRPDGALRLREDPRPRHPGGDRGDPDRRQPDRAEGGGPQAALLGDLHRHRRPVRRRRADHHDRRRVRLAVRAVLPSDRGRAQDAARRRRRRRHDGDLRHADRRGPAGGRAAAVRVEAAQLHPCRARRVIAAAAAAAPARHGPALPVAGASRPASAAGPARPACVVGVLRRPAVGAADARWSTRRGRLRSACPIHWMWWPAHRRPGRRPRRPDRARGRSASATT